MMLRDRTSDVVFGTLFLLVAFGAWGIALPRRRSGVGVLIWLGALSAIEARPLFPLFDDEGLLPHWLHVTLPYLGEVLSYLVVVVAVLAFLLAKPWQTAAPSARNDSSRISDSFSGCRLFPIYWLVQQSDALQPSPRRLFARCAGNRGGRAKTL